MISRVNKFPNDYEKTGFKLSGLAGAFGILKFQASLDVRLHIIMFKSNTHKFICGPWFPFKDASRSLALMFTLLFFLAFVKRIFFVALLSFEPILMYGFKFLAICIGWLAR